MEKDLNQEWTLRNENYDSNILLSTILNKGASFGVLYEDPLRFKFMSDMWFEKHRRTFEKWFEAFDLPYQPLRNYLEMRKANEKTSEDSNVYNNYKDNKDVNSTHIGDKSTNEDLLGKTAKEFVQKEVSDNDTTKGFESAEITDKDTKSILVGSGDSNDTNNGAKDSTNEHVLDKDTDVVTKFDYDDKTTYTDRETTRTPSLRDEQRVSAYNAGNELYPSGHPENPYYDAYAPSELNLHYGEEKTTEKGDVNVNHKTNNDDGANLVHTDETINQDNTKFDERHYDDNTSHSEYDESNVGSEDQTVRTSTNEQGTNDTTIDTTYNDQTSDIRNTRFSEENKYNDSSITRADGDRTTKSNNISDKDINDYIEGLNRGVAYQDLLAKEVKVQMFTIYDQMAELFVDEMCIRIYLSNRQRGGCCWW